MKRPLFPTTDTDALRDQAEAQLPSQQTRTDWLTWEEAQRLVHELQVHQVELELQNHALLQLREQLEQSLEKYTDLYDFSPTSYFTLARDSTIQELNLAGATLLGMERASLIGRRFGLFVSPESLPTFNAFLQRLRSGITKEHCEIVVEREGAPVRHWYLEGLGLGDESHGQYRVVVLDITERRQVEKVLLRGTEHIRSLFMQAPVGIFQSTPAGQFIFVNPALATLLGFSSPEETLEIVNRTSIAEAIYEDPSRRPQLVAAVEQAQGTWKLYENRYRRQDGRVVDALLNFGEHPDPITGERYLYGFVQDITERKVAENILRKSEARYRSLFENLLNGFAYCQMLYKNGQPDDYIHLNVNKAFEKLTGLQNIVGKKITEVLPGIRESDPQLFTIYGRVANTGIPEKFEIYSNALQNWFDISVYSPEKDHFVVIFDNITERKRADEDIRRSEEQYRAVIETSIDGFWIVDVQGRILAVNDAYIHLSGYTREELLKLRIADMEGRETPQEVSAHLEADTQEGNRHGLFQTMHRTKSGRLWQAEINYSYWPIDGGRFFAFIRDINRRSRSEALLKVRLLLTETARTGSLDDLLSAALDQAERLTGSQIGFFHFVEPDQVHLTLQTWSTNTLKTLCTAAGKGQHYPIDQAGVWADCVRQRRPIIHNDYASLPNRKGLPPGHAPVLRELTVPILRDEEVRAIFGIGNKPDAYHDDDLEIVQQIADMTMEVVERKSAEARIAHLAYHDALTQLPNRALLTDRLQQAMAQAQRDGKQLAICYLDLDGFKPINDLYGHAQGDRVLIEVAQRLKTGVRAGDTVARLGGDEFVLLLGELSDLVECERTLDRVIVALRTPFMVANQSVQLGASLGITLYPDDDADPDTLIRHVDQVMYAAKQAGGNCYQWFDPAQDRRARNDRNIVQRVLEGLKAGEFRLHYQPKVNMRDGVVIGAEALIRWQHPDEGLLPPVRFIPAIDASDLGVAVGQWVLNEALRQMSVWAAQGLLLPVSINLSGRHLQQPDFIAQLQAALAAYPTVRPHWLELEILETATLDNMASVSALITGCQKLGVLFALDDFGTGYSSLTYLRHLPVDLLKIDQSFVRDLLIDTEALAIVKGVIGLSAAFHRGVIAEGVETVEHGRRLLDLGCDCAQGYGIARPMPPEQIPGWIAGWTQPATWANRAEPLSARND